MKFEFVRVCGSECDASRSPQLWRHCNGEEEAVPPSGIVVELRRMSLQLGLMGDVNMMRMKMAIDSVQVIMPAMFLQKSNAQRPRSGFRRAKALHAGVHVSPQAREAAHRSCHRCNVRCRRSHRLVANRCSSDGRRSVILDIITAAPNINSIVVVVMMHIVITILSTSSSSP